MEIVYTYKDYTYIIAVAIFAQGRSSMPPKCWPSIYIYISFLLFFLLPGHLEQMGLLFFLFVFLLTRHLEPIGLWMDISVIQIASHEKRQVHSSVDDHWSMA